MKIKGSDAELYYEQYGDGEPIIFSHGWLDNCSVWKPQVASLAKDHRVIVYDLRGHGGSDKPRGDCSIQTMAGDLSSIVQSLGPGKVTLVGFSMGGAVSLVYALLNPDRVARLVLIGTAGRMPRSSYVLLLPLTFCSYRFLIKQFYPRVRFNRPSPTLVNAFVSTSSQVPKSVAYDSLSELVRHYDVRDRVSEIKVPTLIIRGEKDPGMPKAVESLSKSIAGSTLRVIPGGGHEVMVEKPEEFGLLLKEFLANTP